MYFLRSERSNPSNTIHPSESSKAFYSDLRTSDAWENTRSSKYVFSKTYWMIWLQPVQRLTRFIYFPLSLFSQQIGRCIIIWFLLLLIFGCCLCILCFEPFIFLFQLLPRQVCRCINNVFVTFWQIDRFCWGIARLQPDVDEVWRKVRLGGRGLVT